MRLPCDEIFARKVEVWKRSGMQVEENLHSSQDISQEADMTAQPVVVGLTLEVINTRLHRNQIAANVQMSC